MGSVLAIATLAALLAIAATAFQSVQNDRAEERARIHERLERVTRAGLLAAPAIAKPSHPAWQWIEPYLWRAGLKVGRWHGAAAIFTLVTVVGTATLARGLFGGVLALAVLAGLVVAYVNHRIKKRRDRVLEQLPGFLDHVIRAVQTGSSLPNAMLAATAEVQDPIRDLFERVARQTRFGASLEEAFEQAAQLYTLRELDVLALTLRVSQRYGGSVRDMLTSIVAMIRQRERLRREFAAMTGETRLSAWILGALPVVMALYVSVVNPGYIGGMWEDPAGRIALGISVGLQMMGSLVLWRMVKSV